MTLLRCRYNSHYSMICYLDSKVPHQWQFICSYVISFRSLRVSLLPSHPMRILNMYLISLIICLFSLKYFWAFIQYSFLPNSQNSLRVGNSFSTIVLYLACYRMFLFICFFTIYFHLFRSLLQCIGIYSKSVMFISIKSCFQYLIVCVYSSLALWNRQLCSVLVYSTVFPIITSVFLRFR